MIGASLKELLLKEFNHILANKQLSCSVNSTNQTVYHSFDYMTISINGGIKIRPQKIGIS